MPVDHQDGESGNCALHVAAANGHAKIVEWLLVSKNANVNLQNKAKNTALHWASLTGHLEVVKVLAETDLKDQKLNPNIKNQFGKLAFEEALQARQTEVAEYLAQISKLEEDKFYSEIPEQQWIPEGTSAQANDQAIT